MRSPALPPLKPSSAAKAMKCSDRQWRGRRLPGRRRQRHHRGRRHARLSPRRRHPARHGPPRSFRRRLRSLHGPNGSRIGGHRENRSDGRQRQQRLNPRYAGRPRHGRLRDAFTDNALLVKGDAGDRGFHRRWLDARRDGQQSVRRDGKLHHLQQRRCHLRISTAMWKSLRCFQMTAAMGASIFGADRIDVQAGRALI